MMLWELPTGEIPVNQAFAPFAGPIARVNAKPGFPASSGRKLLYPRSYGIVTAGANNTCHVGVSYNSLRIQGYAYGSHGLQEGLTNEPDDCIFPNVSLETEFGREVKTKARIPLMTGALGSTFVAQKYWDSFAIGARPGGNPGGYRRKRGGRGPSNPKSPPVKNVKARSRAPPNWNAVSMATCATSTDTAPLSFSSMLKTPETVWPNLSPTNTATKSSSN